MRIGRTIIIPAILALGAAGTILASSAAPVAAAQTPNVSSTVTGIYYHG
jgi:hypothetical protein